MINLLFLHLRTFDKCFNTTSRINVAEKCIFQTKILAFAGNWTGQDRRQVCWRILERSGVKSEKWNVCIFMGRGGLNTFGCVGGEMFQVRANCCKNNTTFCQLWSKVWLLPLQRCGYLSNKIVWCYPNSKAFIFLFISVRFMAGSILLLFMKTLNYRI